MYLAGNETLSPQFLLVSEPERKDSCLVLAEETTCHRTRHVTVLTSSCSSRRHSTILVHPASLQISLNRKKTEIILGERREGMEGCN